MTDEEKNDLEFRGDMREVYARQKNQERALRFMYFVIVVLSIAMLVLMFSEIRRNEGSADAQRQENH